MQNGNAGVVVVAHDVTRRYGQGDTAVDALRGVSLEIGRGQLTAVMGASGSGKSTLMHILAGLDKPTEGSVSIAGTEITRLKDSDLTKLRREHIGFVFQFFNLLPMLTAEENITLPLSIAGEKPDREFFDDLIGKVGLANRLTHRPAELSGGQQQRVGLAMAFACRPSVIVLDEPTTGLDVSTQAHVLQTVRQLCREHGVAALYITHDLAVVATLVDRVAVLYAGRIVEHGPAATMFDAPAHPYTRHLIAAVPAMSGERTITGLPGRAPSPGHRPAGCAFAPRCSAATEECRASFPPIDVLADRHAVRCYHPTAAIQVRDHAEAAPSGVGDVPGDAALTLRRVSASYSGHTVVRDVDLHVGRGECVALVGESGSGKTTVSRSVGGLHHEWAGEIHLGATALARAARDRPVEQRLRIQYVFQNPYSSLNPRRSIGESVVRPLIVGGTSASDARRAVADMLERVSLTADYADRYPDQLSGGERQRVAIARALVSKPEVLVCDEVTSALDVLVQAAIVELLAELQRELGLSMLFVTHNLPLVRSIADRTAVMADGRLVEVGTTEQVLSQPEHEYTKRLLADTPRINETRPVEAVEERLADDVALHAPAVAVPELDV